MVVRWTSGAVDRWVTKVGLTRGALKVPELAVSSGAWYRLEKGLSRCLQV